MAAITSPLRVLHVYSGNLYGGIETFLRALAEERNKCPDMAPEFALCFEGRIADELRASGAPLYMLGAVRLSRPWTVLRARRALAKVLRERRPDVVVCHAAWPYAIFSSVVRGTKTRLVFYRHDIGSERDWMNMLAGRITPDLVIANSNYTARTGHPRFAATYHRTVFYVIKPSHFSKVEARAAVRTALRAEAEDVVILQASRMQSWKGQALLIDALALLPRHLAWKCWFAGDAQRAFEKAYVDELKDSVARHNLTDRVSFLGQRDDVAALMNGADIFCQPNPVPEPFGIVFVEALSAGLPVVTTTVAGGALEILDPTCSAVSAPSAAEIARTLETIIAATTTRAGLSTGARLRATAFTDSALRLSELAGVLRIETLVFGRVHEQAREAV